MIVAGAYILFLIEFPREGAQITILLEAFWWVVTTVTTVGYGDVVSLFRSYNLSCIRIEHVKNFNEFINIAFNFNLTLFK